MNRRMSPNTFVRVLIAASVLVMVGVIFGSPLLEAGSEGVGVRAELWLEASRLPIFSDSPLCLKSWFCPKVIFGTGLSFLVVTMAVAVPKDPPWTKISATWSSLS